MSEEKVETVSKEEKETTKRFFPGSAKHSLVRGTDEWRHDSVHEFYSEYRKGFDQARFDLDHRPHPIFPEYPVPLRRLFVK
jgi:hypothetical protein